MFFKAITVFRLDERAWLDGTVDLAGLLAKHPLPALLPSAIETRGWHPAVREVNGAAQFTLLRDFRNVPAAAIRRALGERIEELRDAQGFMPGRKQIRDAREEIIARMTPSVPVQRGLVTGVLDRRDGWLLIDTSSPGRSDDFTHELRKVMGSLPAKPLAAGRSSMASYMTRWLAAREAPAPFAFDGDCALVARDETGSSVRYAHHDLKDDGVVDHLRSGKLAKELALTWAGRVAFVINDRMVIRRLRFLNDVQIAENRMAHAADAEDDADLALMIGELREMLRDLQLATEALDAC